MIAASSLLIVLTLLISFIFPPFYMLFFSESLQVISLSIASSFLVSISLEALIKKIINMNFSIKYPEGIYVYNLDAVKEHDVWSELKVPSYPDSEYISNPALADAEKFIEEEHLDSLQKKPVYITGSAGTGKSTAAVRIMSLYQKRYRRRLFKQPKLVLVTETIAGNYGLQFPEFSEPILVLVDDYQFLEEKDQTTVRHLISIFERGERKGLVVCISREHPHHPTPVTVAPTHVDCNVQTTEKYVGFIISLIFQGARQNNITISDDVALALAKKVLAMHEPPLYAIFLLVDHKDSELTMADLERLPEGMRVLCKKSWDKLDPSQKDLVRSILILKRISYSPMNHIASRLHSCFFEREDFNDVRPSMEHSIWFSTKGDLMVAPDSPYEVVEYDDLKDDIKELAKLLIGSHHDRNKTACLIQIEAYYILLGNLGLYLSDTHENKLAEDCHRRVADIAFALNDKKTVNIAWTNLGVILDDMKRFDEAEEAYKRAIEIDPDYAQAWYNLGVLLYDMKRFDEALDACKKALEIDPDYAKAWYNLGLLLDDMKRFDEAEEAYKRAIEIDPDYAPAWSNLGGLLKQLEKYDEALDACKKALEIDPEEVSVWYNLGVLLNDMKRFDKAIDAYKRALEIDPDYAPAWSNLGVLLDHMKRFDEAIDAYKRALEIDPDYAQAWSNLGVLLNDMKRFDEAEEAYKRALEIDPDLALAWYNLGVLLFNRGEKEEGCKAIMKARENAHLFEGLMVFVEEVLKECEENEGKTD
jgi:tetratricopeptide (TPR) repeat protein